ncbi:hypothetical protein [Acinetobacter sp. A47]|uniref:hypothetical protein n=1 Tax=Acinetobacter sp. A47 TaxID=1561217 RepID=UPI0005711CC3|nr:hypothetical protein [Acinetobacter sp. A47]
MGDRCTCHITVKASDQVRAVKIFQNYGWGTYCFNANNEGTMTFEVCEVNYGDLDAESQTLLEAGIEHSIWNGEGGEYGEGYTHYRFTEKGELYKAEYTDKGEFIDPDTLKVWLNTGNLDYVEEKLAEHIRYTTTPGYDMTGLNAKRYLMAQMVKPK